MVALVFTWVVSTLEVVATTSTTALASAVSRSKFWVVLSERDTRRLLFLPVLSRGWVTVTS